jgi:hypothetical protein
LFEPIGTKSIANHDNRIESAFAPKSQRVFQQPALMFAVKSLGTTNYPGCARVMISVMPKAGGGAKDDG